MKEPFKVSAVMGLVFSGDDTISYYDINSKEIVDCKNGSNSVALKSELKVSILIERFKKDYNDVTIQDFLYKSDDSRSVHEWKKIISKCGLSTKWKLYIKEQQIWEVIRILNELNVSYIFDL